MFISYFVCLILCSVVSSNPIEENGIQNLQRVPRSPTFHKKGPIAVLLGGLGNGGGSYGGHGGGSYGSQGGSSHAGVNNYISVNNYGSHPQTSHQPHQTVNYGNGHGSSFAGSAAVAGGHGSSQSQSQSASLSVGPYTASFSQSQAQGGRGYSSFFDY